MRVCYFVYLGGVLLTLGGSVSAQEVNEHQRTSLAGLKTFAVHAQLQVAGQATLQPIEESLLRTRIDRAVRREGIVIQDGGDVRNGSAAQISLTYLVMPIRNKAGHEAGFAASSCIHASQYVRLPRQEVGGRIVYTVAPTWSSCSMMVGDTSSYRNSILRNADGQIARFLDAWRSVNPVRRAAPAPSI